MGSTNAHNHSHGHDHAHHHGDLKGKRLLITILLNIFITGSQVGGGLLSGSLSLLSDAAHNFSDVVALMISWIADKLSHKKYSSKQTYGFKRAEVLAALINVVTIIVIAINILIEGIQRITNPVEVEGMTVIILAALSILLNGASVLIIKDDAKDSMNIKSAYLHLFSDMLTSIAVLVGGLVMMFFKVYWVDSLISFVIATYLLITSYKLLMSTIKVLMQFTPDEIEIDQVAKEVQMIEGIKNIHHVHAWRLTDTDTQFQAHITFEEDLSLSVVGLKIKDVKALLRDKYHINHATLEAEYLTCENQDLIHDER